MTSSWPNFHIGEVATVPQGSIFWIPRDTGWLALAVGEPRAGRSFVVLSGTERQLPLYAENWRNIDACLCFDTVPRWEPSFVPGKFTPNLNDWWQTPGVMVAAGNRLWLRASTDIGLHRQVLVDVLSGSVLEGPSPGEGWSFSTWRIVLPAPSDLEPMILLDYKAPVSPAT
jgi:hypothetical protein